MNETANGGKKKVQSEAEWKGKWKLYNERNRKR